MLAAIPSPSSNGFFVGPLFVHAYGLAYLFGVLAAIALTTRRWRAQGGSPSLVHEVALWGFAGIIGGRLYFLMTSWNEVPDHWWGPLAIWKGGLGIWGGIALGTLVGLLVLRRRGGHPALHGRRRSRPARRPSHREDRQLLQLRAVRRSDEPAVGPAHRPRPSTGRL